MSLQIGSGIEYRAYVVGEPVGQARCLCRDSMRGLAAREAPR
jgi:hypothetical protein